MIKSIRYFLLISLLISITIASAINGTANYLLDEQVIQPFLDNQLIRVSSLIDILARSTKFNNQARQQIINYLHHDQYLTSQKFFFQVWNEQNQLIMNSHHLANTPLYDVADGFSDRDINGNDWRIYAFYDEALKVKIIVGELYNLRRELADDIAHSNANILLITYPVFGILVWIIISFALRSITSVTNEISNRASTFLEPVELNEIPHEIKPLVAELNQLFTRLRLAFARNKRFAADAAHELRTPLAALKTHVQLALQANNKAERNKALQRVIESVDRSSHVVTQLLTLSRLGEEETLTDIKPFDLHKLAIEISAYLAPQALEKNIEIELTPAPNEPPIIMGNDIAVGILMRNIVDNAIRYTPERGAVKIAILVADDQVILQVTDTGSGIPVALRDRVFERFYRILGTKETGSGLGLAIVRQIAYLHNAQIELATPKNGIGLQFNVAFPLYPA